MKKVLLSADELNMIQTLRNQKAQQGTANASGNNGSNQTTGTTEERKPQRRYNMQPVYKVLRKAKRLYYAQVVMSVENKVKCIETALASMDNLYPDKLRFELDFRTERERLVDSIKFSKACKALELDPVNVADHVVFEGKGVLEKVLKEGLQVVGEKAHMFNAPLWKDTENLYSKEDKESKDD